jgi:ABC-2 type transport system permease protein
MGSLRFMSIIVTFELRRLWRRQTTIFYASFFMLAGLFLMAGSAGVFGPGSSSEIIANAPFDIFSYVRLASWPLILLIAVFSAQVLGDDYSLRQNQLIYALPVPGATYFMAKHVVVGLSVAVLALLFLFGLVVGTQLPGLEQTKLLPFTASPYLQLYFVYLLPGIFVYSSAVVLSIALTRQATVGIYIIFCLLLLRELLSGMIAASWLDPMAVQQLAETAALLTTGQRDSSTLPMLWHGLRQPWLLAILVLLPLLLNGHLRLRQGWRPALKKIAKAKSTRRKTAAAPLQPIFTSRSQWYRLLVIAKHDFLFFLRQPFLWLLLLLAAGLVLVSIMQLKPQGPDAIIPVTWFAIGYPLLFYRIFLALLTFLFATILSDRTRRAGMDELVLVTPVSSAAFTGANLTVLILMQGVFLLLLWLIAITVQVLNGVPIEPFLAWQFILFEWPALLVWAVTAVFTTNLIRQKWLAFFLLALLPFAVAGIISLGLDFPLLHFNRSPVDAFYLRYSDFNGFGHSLPLFLHFQFFWLLVAAILAILAIVIYPRQHGNLADQLRQWADYFPYKWAFLPLLLIFLAIAGQAFFMLSQRAYATEAPLDKDKRSFDQRQQASYGRLAELAKPAIDSLVLQLDIYPGTRHFTASGHYLLRNHTAAAIDTLLLRVGFDEETHFLEREWVLLHFDPLLRIAVVRARQSFLPGMTKRLFFRSTSISNQLWQQESNVLSNGTLLRSDFLPRLGLWPLAEWPLPEKASRQKSYYWPEAGRFAYRLSLSTDIDQTPLAPGIRVGRDEVIESNGQLRRRAEFRSYGKVKPALTFLSGTYVHSVDSSDGIVLHFYYHPGHHHALARLRAGVKAALTHNRQVFGDLPYREIRLVEFSRQVGSFATLTGNLMAISELRLLSAPGTTATAKHDLAFYVAAHEMCHYWWGDALMPAAAAGATMLTESISEYLTTQIYAQAFTQAKANDFLNWQAKRYRRGLASGGQQVALIHVRPGDDHIAYSRGALVFAHLRDVLGQDEVNRRLQAFFAHFQQQSDVYPFATDLLPWLKTGLDEKMQSEIDSLFTLPAPSLEVLN